MPDSLIDIGGGVKMINPQALSQNNAGALENTLSLVNLQNQIANAPLERKKLEIETALKANDLLNLDVQNLLERANLNKAIGDEQRAMTKSTVELYQQLPGIFDIDFNAGVDVLRRLHPDANATLNNDKTVTVEIPTEKIDEKDGQPVKSTETIKIAIDPNKLNQKQRTDLEKEWSDRFNSNQTVKDFAEISRAYKNLQGVSNQATGQGDVALMQYYMNILNPGSALRPGQMATLENVGGLGSAFVNLWNKAITEDAPVFGKDPNSKERRNFVNAARVAYENARSDVLSIGRNTVEFAKSQGLNPRAILQPVGDLTVKNFTETPEELLKRVNQRLDKIGQNAGTTTTTTK